MEMMISDIKTASLLTFEINKSNVLTVNSIFNNNVKGILEDDYFIDIETNQLYPILYCNESVELYEIPKVGVEYVYAVESYFFGYDDDKNELLKKANESHEWYINLKELEKTGKIISFQKRKIRKEVG